MSTLLAAGVDVVRISRIERVLAQHRDRFLERVFTEREVAWCRGRVPELAARFAAKEAAAKALGVGMRILSPAGIRFADMEVLPDRLGQPHLTLFGSAAQRAQDLGLTEWAISLSHEGDLALAFVVAQS